MIPRIVFRTVPVETTAEVEELWAGVEALHPGWRSITYRDPLDPVEWPRTAPYWSLVENGAQLAGLIRLEALARHGGVYLDSDVRLYRPLDPLLDLAGFAGYEDRTIVPDAVLGFEAGHPVVEEALGLAIARLRGISGEARSWQTDRGAWATGPGVTTALLPTRDDVLVLPPDAFYPVHYAPRETLAARLDEFEPAPWTFGVHLWSWSWR